MSSETCNNTQEEFVELLKTSELYCALDTMPMVLLILTVMLLSIQIVTTTIQMIERCKALREENDVNNNMEMQNFRGGIYRNE